MTKWKMVNQGGFHCLAVEANGKLYILHRMAPIGHCLRFGQRYIGDVQ